MAGLSSNDEVVTFRMLLELEEVRRGAPEVLNGHADLDRPVRWVHVADTEGVGALIEGGELVLSTAAGFRTSTTRLRRFLSGLEAGGAAAALIELVDESGLPDGAAVATLRQAVRGLTMPIVLLNRRIKFVRVTQAGHRLLIGQQLARLERSRQVHEIYTQLNLDGADEQQIVETTARLLEGPVLLEDVAHRVLLSAGPDPDTGETASAGRPDETDGTAWAGQVVGAAGSVWGRLVAPWVDPDDAGDMLVLERAAQALTLARMAARDQADLLHRAQAGFLQALMAGDLTEDEAQERADGLGLAPARTYVPVVVHMSSGPERDLTLLQLRERVAQEEWISAARPLMPVVLSASLRSGTFALLLGLRETADVDTALTEVVARVRSRTDRTVPRDADRAGPGGCVAWTVGVGPARDTLNGAAVGVREAAQVARTAAATETRDLPFYRFSDIRLRGLVALLADDPRVRTFAEAELGPLLTGHPPWGMELLALYLRHGGNKSEVARAGHLSRQALYARLERLETALGVSLDDAESRAALHVALLWARLHT